MKADLHMHSTHSDGRKTTFEVIDLAKKNNVDIIAITDHDTVMDVASTIAYGLQQGVTVLPGIELSTLEQGKSVHILGYFTDESYQNEELISYFKEIKQKREERAKKMIQKLKEHYDIDITYDQVSHFAHGIIARPHIAKAITKKYPNFDHDYIFDHFIGDHCEAYVPSVELPVQEGLDLLKKHNCVTVLAHPTLLKPHIKDKVLSYEYDGIEAIYYRNQPGEETYFRTFAKDKNMIITAGSDYHGIKNDTKHGEIGDVSLTGKDLEAFLNLVKKRV